jgi:hypothetical protein
MNLILIEAFINHIKKQKNGPIKQRRKLVAEINDCFDQRDRTINPILLQQTGYTSDGKITVR